MIVVALAVLLPGIWRYTLVDPWETHYGEVARMMLQQHDWVHLEWPQDGEGFRSKPVLQFWMMAASMRATGVAHDGGYSGEMIDAGGRTMFAIRLPFVLSAIAGLTLMWWMLARLVSRRLAWLALLVVGSCPFFCLVARQAIPDMPLLACVIGAIAMFTMAVEDGDAPIATLWTVRIRHRAFRFDARHVLLAIAGGFVVVQALYYFDLFRRSPGNALGLSPALPQLVMPLLMFVALAALSRTGWQLVRLALVPVAASALGIAFGVSLVVGTRRHLPARGDLSLLAYARDRVLPALEPCMPDRLLIRAIAVPVLWASGLGWSQSDGVADRLLRMAPLTRMGQVYLLWFYWLIGVSILAKGPPGLAVVGLVAFFHVVLLNRWRALYEGSFEIKRGLIFMTVTFLPWHLAMWMKDGNRFIAEYIGMHIFDRATIGVDNSPGTFEYYTSQIGHGMWLWAALVPVAVVATFLRARLDTREGRVRFTIALWAISGVAFFSLVQTKFHHYILPAVPALAILVAFYLDDILAKRDRLPPLMAAIGVGIVLLVARDLMFDPKRWIEMFVFLYNRPWPSGEPWSIDPSDGFLALGLAAAAALVALACFRRIGVACVVACALAICIWAQHVYMPLAGQHWGMRDAVASYYKQRAIYGEKLVYYGSGELHDDWHDHGDTWRIETMLPDALQLGQPMTITVELHKPGGPKPTDDERQIDATVVLLGTATTIGDHAIEITLNPGERDRLAPLIAKGRDGPRGRPAVRVPDTDKLIAYQLYWRGENFWSADEIVGPIPEMKTAFKNADNVELMKYLNDRARAPIGRRYFVVATAGQIASIRGILPTARARDSYAVIETSSNKFSMAAFDL